jgi:hypothetical protein
VLVEELSGGELRLLPTEKLREQIARIGRRVVDQHTELGTGSGWRGPIPGISTTMHEASSV